MPSFVEFEILYKGQGYEVSGQVGWEGGVEPQQAPDPECRWCHGEGIYLVGTEPPDEWNDAPEEIYERCDCWRDVPGTGSPGHATFAVEWIVGPNGDELTDEEIAAFVEAFGASKLAEEALEYAAACQE